MSAHAADAAPAQQTRWLNYREGDFVIRNYVFRSGEGLPELKLHYRTLGTARRNTAGKIINGVLLLQGNTRKVTVIIYSIRGKRSCAAGPVGPPTRCTPGTPTSSSGAGQTNERSSCLW